MKKSILFNLFALMIMLAPLVDVGSRSLFVWGDPDFPSEEI